jgi:hypothetical protein
MNEAHAWVEVHDGHLYRRIDLGGAGRALQGGLASGARHAAPVDPYRWPPGAGRGEELAQRARSATSSPAPEAGRSASGPTTPNGSASPSRESAGEADTRPPSVLRVAVTGEARRNAPLVLSGSVTADGEPCSHLAVEVALRPPGPGSQQELSLGVVATDEKGAFKGALVVPRTASLGEYDVVARTRGNTRCGRGVGP